MRGVSIGVSAPSCKIQGGHAPGAEISGCYAQVVQHLQEAAHHWSRAAFSLDGLLPTDLDTAMLARARQLARIARTQQARLWKLTGEVLADKEEADLRDKRKEEKA